MDSISFGKRVAFLRKKNEMTQIQLAEKLNVTNKAVSRWETGEGYPEITLLKPLAEILNTNVDYLLSNESNQSGELNKLNQLGESNSTDRFLDSEKKRLLNGMQNIKNISVKPIYIPKFDYSKGQLLLISLSILVFIFAFFLVYGMLQPIRLCGLTGSFWLAMTASLFFYCVFAIILHVKNNNLHRLKNNNSHRFKNMQPHVFLAVLLTMISIITIFSRNDIFKNENQENCIAIENPFYYYMLAGFTVLFVLWILYNLWNYIRTKSIQITIKSLVYSICLLVLILTMALIQETHNIRRTTGVIVNSTIDAQSSKSLVEAFFFDNRLISFEIFICLMAFIIINLFFILKNKSYKYNKNLQELIMFGKSLTACNKWGTMLTGIAVIIAAFAFMYTISALSIYSSGLETVINIGKLMIFINIPRVIGMISAIVIIGGIVFAHINAYEKQTHISVILLFINIVLIFVWPVIGSLCIFYSNSGLLFR